MQIIKSIENNSIPVLKLNGRFDGLGANTFDDEISLMEDLKYLILDFENVNYLSSAGIRVMLKTDKMLRSVKGRMFIINVSQNITQVLKITGLLDGFFICSNLTEALTSIDFICKGEANSLLHKIKDKSYSIKSSYPGQCKFKLWGNTRLDDRMVTSERLILSSLDELNFSFSIGAAAVNRKEASENIGNIITTKNFLGITSVENGTITDFTFSKKPDETFLYIKSAISIEGRPSILFDAKYDNPYPVQTLMDDLFTLLSETNNNFNLFGFVIIAGIENIDYKDQNKRSSAKGFISIGTAIDRIEFEKADEKNKKLIESLIGSDDDLSFYSNKILLKDVNTLSESEDIENALNSVLQEDNISDASYTETELKIREAKVWLFCPDEIDDGEARRLKIEFENDFQISDEYELIIRKIYSDCSRITLKQLHGGFSAKTFQVFGYDKNGIRILPTVLKLGSLSCIKREAEHYDEFVNKYILNNSTSIMGSYFHNNSGGVRYNFVGINGPDTKLKWLTHHYIEKSAEEIIPLFDRIFTNIMRPWYGQPKLDIITPYKEHNPTITFFPEIFDDAKKELGIDPDMEKIYFNELGREIINPYWFLKYEFKKRENYSRLWYKCISHGDLNMQNILLDEINNIYMIDFSETQFRNAVSDFARLEPIVKFEIPLLNTDEELKYMAEYEEGLLKVNKLCDKPEFIYKGNDPSVDKSYKVICRLREYANTVTLFETDLVPYLLAILEWTYPVVSYYGLDIRRKKLSAISAALICEKIISMDNDK